MHEEGKCIRLNQMMKRYLRSKDYKNWSIYETSEWNISSV